MWQWRLSGSKRNKVERYFDEKVENAIEKENKKERLETLVALRS